MKKLIQVTSLLLYMLSGSIMAQAPLNDHCENASGILISQEGYGFGKFLSDKMDVSEATRQFAEHCTKELEETGNCTKTVWYKFYIPTTRNVSIKLTQQDSAIPQIFAGFNMYRVPSCNYTLSDLEMNLPPLNKFGISGNSCLGRGWYLIQVGCKKKAKGELWVELDVSEPASESYDSVMGYYDFGMIRNERREMDFGMKCSSLEPSEEQPIGDSTISQSIWFAVTFPKNALYNAIYFKYGTSNLRIKYRIFMGQIDKDSLKSLKPFLELQANAMLLSSECPFDNTSDKRYYIQLITENIQYTLNIVAENKTYQADGWNTPNTNNVIDLDYKYQAGRMHYFNCEAYLNTHGCKNVIPPYFVNKEKISIGGGAYKNITDTFRIGAYTILNVLEDGGLQVETSNQQSNSKMLYSLYEGDIRNTCNLVHLLDTMIHENNWIDFKYCIKKGTYTLLTSVLDFRNPDKFQAFSLVKDNNIIKYYHPLNPERLKNFDPVKGPAVSSEKISFRNKDTMIQIGQVKIEGDMTFSEIYISESSDLNISSYNCHMYLFSGELSKSTAKTIPGIDYSKGQYALGSDKCFYLDKGFYTFVLLRNNDINKYGECFPVEHYLYFYPNNICPPNNNIEPQFAFPINKNKDVLSATGNLNKLDYEFTLNYCKDCRNKSTIIPYLSCKTKAGTNKQTIYYYFTFYLEKNASFIGIYDYIGNSAYELFEGDASKNIRIVLDSSKSISACKGGNIICNLQGKKMYTLVVPRNIESSPVNSIKFALHRPSVNDFAAQSYDFGHFTGGETRQSTFIPITCHTNGLKSDPFYNSGDYTDFVIPYKDTLNFRRVQGRKNLWYTFTVSGPLKINFGSQSKFDNQNRELCLVYRYNGPYHKDFAGQLTDNFDSTKKTMQFITESNYWGRTGTFYNCGENRYFMLLDNYYNYSTEEYTTHVSSELLTVPQDGDFCTNAVTGNYTSYGSYKLITNNACHTYGGSPGEIDKPVNTKSTWFKISVKNLQKFDLEIKPISINEIKSYKIYGGTCGAMTKVTTGGNGHSYFTLSCMGAGDYYIQALSYAHTDNNIEFSVKILNPVNAVCKPYNFKYPLALFKIRGGCNDQDTVVLENASTIGSDMTYAWYRNGQLFSNDINPVFTRLDPGLKDSNMIRLVASNQAEFTKDTFELLYLRDTVHYTFRILGPSISWCYDTLSLSVQTNYPKKINYAWTYNNYGDGYIFSYRSTYASNRTQNLTYKVIGESENCHFSDTFTTNVITTLHRYKDTFFCEGQRYVIKNNTKMYMHINSKNLTPGDSAVFTSTDRILVRYEDSSCYYEDSVRIEVEKGPGKLLLAEQIYTCNTASRILEYTKEPLLAYNWNTGDTTPSITATKSGFYRLLGAFSKCRSLDYSFYLTMENRSTDLLKDTTVCKYDDFPFTNPYGSNFNILYKTPNVNTIMVTGPVKRVLKVQRSECFIADSALIDIFPFEGRTIDSFYCDEKINFSMFLNGGDARQFNWYHHHETDRFLLIHGYGNYPVARIDNYGCKDTLNFNVITNCEFTVFIPNAFTPNDDYSNELFGPVISGRFTNYSMSLYDRWGEMVYNSSDSKTWDGYYKGIPVIAGVYTYYITVFDKDNKPYIFKGTVTVLY